MRLKFNFHCEKSITIPLCYYYSLQGMLYHFLSSKLSQKIHDEGFRFGKRVFKMFVFSRIFGKTKALLNSDKKLLTIYPPNFYFFVSSAYEDFLQDLVLQFLKKGKGENLRLSKTDVFLEKIEVIPFPLKDVGERESLEVIVKTLSPITVHRTFSDKKGDRKEKIHYYSPFEEEFTKLIRDNLDRKWKAFYKEELPQDEINSFLIKPVRVNKKRGLKVVNYKGYWVKGWMGEFYLKGSRRIIEFAWDVGLGARNSQGFGMFDIKSVI